jgi:hypothetical protein
MDHPDGRRILFYSVDTRSAGGSRRLAKAERQTCANDSGGGQREPEVRVPDYTIKFNAWRINSLNTDKRFATAAYQLFPGELSLI